VAPLPESIADNNIFFGAKPEARENTSLPPEVLSDIVVGFPSSEA
jgi:hypothetical protein